MLIPDVVDISRQGTFLQSDVEGLLPIVIRVTLRYCTVVDGLISRLEALNSDQVDRIKEIETEINTHIQNWHIKIRKLGGIPKGLWLVDFDAGDGYFCWKYPEAQLRYWHGYNEGFSNRILIKDRALAKTPKVEQPSKEIFPTI